MTGQDGEDESEAVAVYAGGCAAGRDDLGGSDERLDLDEQRAGSLHRAEHHGAGFGARLSDEPGGGIDHLHQSALAHLEDADLAGRSEAVLQRSHGAEGSLALALEMEHAVDQVLQGTRTRQRALLGDVADQDQGDVEALRGLEQCRCRLPDRSDAARC